MEDRTVIATPEEDGLEKPRGVNVKLVVVAALVIVAVVVGVQWTQSGRFRPVGKGTKAPGFTFENLEAEKVALEDLRGKVVFLNIWATWCEPCRDEMPSMEQLYQKLRGRPFEILAVSIDRDASKVMPFRDEFSLTFPILLDPRSRITRLYRATGVPETFIIDAEGVIAERVIGPRNWGRWANVRRIASLVERAEGPPQVGEGQPAPEPARRPTK